MKRPRTSLNCPPDPAMVGKWATLAAELLNEAPSVSQYGWMHMLWLRETFHRHKAFSCNFEGWKVATKI